MRETKVKEMISFIRDEGGVNLGIPDFLLWNSISTVDNFGAKILKQTLSVIFFILSSKKNIRTFKDDERIIKGKKISDELIGSIKDSKFYIIVFSKNYASSSWCLDELVKIMECHRTTEHTAYTVFYDVEPSEVRKQSGAVGEAFAKYEMEEADGKWRVALKEAVDLAGWELKKTTDG
ncbi:unnamed protein product [Lactuca saligna]|uniref:TIR domain-containing protein n=1 Tax=Lactuca saligna TaxID=75948 RepID=A0AA35YYR2_LACSI|nr:unnamed protein product [Lactuca saligna]